MVLLQNSGIDTVTIKHKFGFGIDVIDGKFKDMIKAGIIDPAKVSRTTIENSVSIASTILTTKVLISDIKEKDEQK